MWDDEYNWEYPDPPVDEPGFDVTGLTANGDGTWTDPETGELFDVYGEVIGHVEDGYGDGEIQNPFFDSSGNLLGENNGDGTYTDLSGAVWPISEPPDPGTDYGTGFFDDWGNPSWWFEEVNGNTVYQSVDVDGSIYYTVYDANGNLLGSVDDYGRDLTNNMPAPNRAARTINPQNPFGDFGNVLSTAQRIGQAYTALTNTNSGTAAQRQAVVAAQQRAQAVAQNSATSSTDKTTTYLLIAAAAAVGLVALSRSRAA